MGLVFWEKQGADRMCGLHCLNALLQGPYFDESNLTDIALELDKMEQSLMSKGPLEVFKRTSHNVSDDGFFSVSVIEQCLKNYGIWVVPINKPSVATSLTEPSKEEAFLCHLHNHWLAIRKVGETWYNLDSLKPAPTEISDFYLSAFLQGMQNEGFSIFVIRPDISLHALRATGDLSQSPVPEPGGFSRMSLPAPSRYLGLHQYRLTKGDIEEMWKAQKKKDKEQEAEVRRVHGDSGDGKDSSGFMNRGTIQTAVKHEWPTTTGNRLDGGAATATGSASAATGHATGTIAEDDEIQNVMKLSMIAFIENLPKPAEEPAAGLPNTMTVQLRFPDGSRHARRFSHQHQLQEIVRWLESVASINPATGESRFDPPLALSEAYSIATGMGITPKTCMARVSSSIQVTSDGVVSDADEWTVADLKLDDTVVNFHFQLTKI